MKYFVLLGGACILVLMSLMTGLGGSVFFSCLALACALPCMFAKERLVRISSALLIIISGYCAIVSYTAAVRFDQHMRDLRMNADREPAKTTNDNESQTNRE